jgi:hypothetical protein
VGTTGLIFAAIAIAWLAYLVPHFARSSGDETIEEADPSSRFSDSMRILRRGTAPLLDQDLAEIRSYEVSTPLTRRAAIADLQRLEGLAARRRRRVLLALLIVLTAVLGVHLAHLVPRWSLAVPGGLLVVFVLVARVSVHAMRRSLDARYAAICRGSDEATVLLSRTSEVGTGAVRPSESSSSTGKPGALWDPVPITMPTYVSKPLAPRTVRTIDLSGPEVSSTLSSSVPVTADAPLPAPAESSPAATRPAMSSGDDMPKAATA